MTRPRIRSSAARGIGRLLAASFTGLAAATFPSAAQVGGPPGYPNRNILLIVPFAPGGPPDVIARVLAPQLGELLGKSIVVENRAGASTSIGTTAVARAAPDGYTLLATSLTIAVIPHILAKPGFDPLADFKHVSLTGTGVMTLVVNPSLPVKSARELVDLARAKPAEIKAAHAGVGTSPHLGTVAFMQAAGVTMLLVPYRGSAQAISDVVAGHVSLLMTAPSTSVGLARDGKVRMLGVTGAHRITAMPEVPTLKEQGYHLSSLDDGVWFGISAPAGTPESIVAKLNAAINTTVRDKAVSATLAQSDVVTGGSTPQAFEKLIRDQLVVWRDLIGKSGIKPE